MCFQKVLFMTAIKNTGVCKTINSYASISKLMLFTMPFYLKNLKDLQYKKNQLYLVLKYTFFLYTARKRIDMPWNPCVESVSKPYTPEFYIGWQCIVILYLNERLFEIWDLKMWL